MNKIAACITNIEHIMKQIVHLCFVALVARAAIFFIFWNSAQTKITSTFAFWDVTETAVDLFTYEYSLPLLAPKIAAYLATFGEFFLSIAVLLGIFTRFAALGLLAMTLVIQLFVYPDAYVVHLAWAAMLLFLINNGAGHLSIDGLLRKK